MQLAENAGRKISPSAHHRTSLSGYFLATKAYNYRQSEKLLNSNISSGYPHNMVNFGPLSAEIGPVVWGTPANFNAALLHGTPAAVVSQSLRR